MELVESNISKARNSSLDVSAGGPRKAVQQLVEGVPMEVEREVWAYEARAQAITGSCPGSLNSARSGMRVWISFYRHGLKRTGQAFPPAINDLLAFSRLFRHPGTFSNYVNYIRLGCELVGVSTEVFAHTALKRAKVAIAKAQAFKAREPMFIRGTLVAQLVDLATTSPALKSLAFLCLTAYVFLLRVPSEALPIMAHVGGEAAAAPVVTVGAESIEIWLPRRKNRLQPSTVRRSCWCKSCSKTCPVHALAPFFQSCDQGERPFAHMTLNVALKGLRTVLGKLNIQDAERYRTHDLRRGHAEDLRVKGATLGEILRAGDWRSPAFLQYLDAANLEHDRTVEAHLCDSSDEEGAPP